MEDMEEGRLCWIDEVKEWTSLSILECIQTAVDRHKWRAVVSSFLFTDLSNEDGCRQGTG